MDPVSNLERQRELAARILEHGGSYHWQDEDSVDGQELAELVQSLDEWRKNGGFDPYIPAAEFPVEAETYYGQQFEKES